MHQCHYNPDGHHILAHTGIAEHHSVVGQVYAALEERNRSIKAWYDVDSNPPLESLLRQRYRPEA